MTTMPGTYDSHVHSWRAWPYEEAAPTDAASGERLLEALSDNGIERALVVCANIDPSGDDNDYVADVVRAWPERLSYAIDVDSFWSPDHHRPGALDRLEALADRHPDAVAVTHYLQDDVESWLLTGEGRDWAGLVTERFGVLSLSAHAGWASVVADLAGAHPTLQILWHHLGGLNARRPDQLEGVLRVAERDNVALKVSGFHYVGLDARAAPWPDATAFLPDLHAAYGRERLCWGSDFPASLRYTDYPTSLAAATQWAERLDDDDRAALMGGALTGIIARRPQGPSPTDERSLP